MAEGRFEPYHVPQQTRRDKLRVVASSQLQGLVPILDPADLITCAGPGLHKEEGSNFMGYIGGGMIRGGSSSATNHLYVDPQSSVQLNPSPIQDTPFFYNPQSLRFLEQSFHGGGGGGGEVMVYRPEPLSMGHGPNDANDHSNSNNNSNKCGQGLSLSLSSHHSQQPTSLPLELNLQRYVFPGGGSTSNELISRSSVPLGPFTGYASILKGSRFLKPARQLLEELCDVGLGGYAERSPFAAADSSLLDPSLECFSGAEHDDPPSCRNGGEDDENRKKKSRLISMLNEVYRRYKQYYQQMQAVISSFETVAGVRNAAPFAHFALKAMSKHFRCLKNAITEQLQLIMESRGHLLSSEKDTAAPGFDNPGNGIHYPRPLQNSGGFMEHQPVWRPQRGLPERAVTVLRSWLFEHFLHPYPTDTDKLMLAKQTGLSRNQVSNWFINARVRLWKPMVEEIHMLETRQVEKQREQTGDGQNDHHHHNHNSIPSGVPAATENASTPNKRCRDQLGVKRTRNDLTMIPAGNENVMNLSYENSSSYAASGGGFGSIGVSLTLGLYQNNSNNLGFPDAYPMSAARRFGLEGNGEGGYAAGGVIAPNRQFGREIVGGQLLHDFVG